MSRTRFAVAVVLAGLGTFAGGRLLRADDPAPAVDAGRLKQLVENLGSDDFRVREAATKELIAMGEKARAALTEAAKSDMPEVRFRADQILRRLDGANRPKGLESGTPGSGTGAGQGPVAPPRGRAFLNDDWEKWQQEMERQAEEMRKRLESGWGATPGMPGFGLPQLFSGLARRGGSRRFTADGAELQIVRGTAKLTFTDRTTPDVTMTTTYEGKSLDAILSAKPELKDRPGVASLVDQLAKSEADEKAREAKAREGSTPMPWGGPLTSFQVNGVNVEVTPGHAKVTVTENDADGKPVTKTYEGTDLEALKAEHPELADKLGGVHFRFGGGTGLLPPGGSQQEKAEDGDEAEDEDSNESVPTGPFGLALAPVDPAERAKLGLAESEGMVVVAVRPKSTAESDGLRRGDVIVKVNGERVDGKVGIADLIHKNVNSSRSFDILRNGKPKQLVTSWK